jgi:hydroxymethylpyrimidine pyrophosphatase-like HAD family hydrolase
MNKTILLDIDGFLLEEKPTFEKCLAKPLKDAAKLTEDLTFSGYTVILWTARGWAEYKMTVQQLNDYGFRYNELLMGKPIALIYADDKSVKTIQELREKLNLNE